MPFIYKKPLNIANNEYPVTPENSPAEMVLLLFLTTHPDFLRALDHIPNPAGDFDVTFKDGHNITIDLQGITGLTGLNRECIQDFFRNTYLLPGKPKKEVTLKRAAFKAVVDSLQAYESQRVNDWDPSFCPGVIGITSLAKQGANVDPAAGQRA